MRFKFISILIFLISIAFIGNAQIDSAKNVSGSDSSEFRVFEKVEIEAKFPGGDEAWRKYVENNLKAETPVLYGAPAGSYTVIVQFVVDKDGNISDVRAVTKHGYGMEGEVIRVIKKGPKWIPAFQDGRNVKAYRRQPVTFVVTDERKKKKKNKD
ncbi:MAG: energy transducer TonB [Bacteroidota bacterium]